MPYLGNTPSTSFATIVKDTFNGGSTGYTLSKVATTNSVSVFVENVRQEPTTAYSVSGTTLTFTASTPSGTGNIYVLHMNPTTTTTHPAAQNLTAVDGTFTGAFTSRGIDDNADATAITIDSSEDVTLSGHLASGVNKNIDLRDADGHVSGRLRNVSGSNNALTIEADPDNSASSTFMSFKVDTSETMRIDSNGNVGIGTDSPSDHLHVKGFIQVEGKSGDGNYIRFDNSANSGNIWRIGPGVYSHTTFSIYNQTDNSQVVNIESVNDQLMFRSMTAVNLADDATAIAVANSFQGIVVVTSSSNALTGIYRCEGQNTPTLISGNSAFTNSDTDGKFCLISAASSSNVTFRNRYGATYGFKIASFGVLS